MDIQDRDIINDMSLVGRQVKIKLLRDKYGMNDKEVSFWIDRQTSDLFDRMDKLLKSPYDYNLVSSYFNNPIEGAFPGHYTFNDHMLVLLHKQLQDNDRIKKQMKGQQILINSLAKKGQRKSRNKNQYFKSSKI